MSDPDVEQEIAANEARAQRRDDDATDDGLLNPLGRVFSMFRDDDVAPDDSTDMEQRRRANDADTRERET